LRGEAILPTLRLQEPNEWADEIHALLKFPKTRIGRTKQKTLVIKNNGTIPATAKFELDHHKAFKFLDQPTFTLPPKQMKAFNVKFTPVEIGDNSWTIQFKTLLNNFECQKIKV
jgi:hypothetical protein